MTYLDPQFEKNAFAVIARQCGGSTFAHELGRISGTVVWKGQETPIPGITVMLYKWNEDGQKWEREASGAESAADGTFIIKGLQTGTYRAYFQDGAAVYVQRILQQCLGFRISDGHPCDRR